MVGFSQFIVGTGGRSVLFTWPMSCLIAEGHNPLDGFSTFSRLTSKGFSELMSRQVVKHAIIEKDTVVYVPFGYSIATVALPHEDRASSIMMPYHSTVLARKADPRVLTSVVKYQKRFLKVNEKYQPWDSVGSAMISWLESLGTGLSDESPADNQVLRDSGVRD